MKTSKTLAAPKTRPVKCIAQRGAYINRLTIGGLEELCDDPARNGSGLEVQAVLTPHDSGFVLTARDDGLAYQFIDERGGQMTFRSIDQASAPRRRYDPADPYSHAPSVLQPILRRTPPSNPFAPMSAQPQAGRAAGGPIFDVRKFTGRVQELDEARSEQAARDVLQAARRKALQAAQLEKNAIVTLIFSCVFGCWLAEFFVVGMGCFFTFKRGF